MRNTSPFLSSKWGPGPTFRGFFFECFLRCSRCRCFMILGARGAHFGFHFGFILRALGLWRNSWKCCKGCQFQRFGPCQTESFYRSWLWVCFGDLFFHFFMIFSCLGAVILRVFGRNRCQKGGLKKRHKKGVKRGARARRRKPVMGVWVLSRLPKGTSERSERSEN